MNLNTTFGRKILYLVILVAMLVPLFLLGQPAGGGGDSGGQLASMRDRYDIAEADLGEINPASETMKLASLGMRGVAATLLWGKAHEYSVRHEWDRLKAALNNIALLQPHFDRVWEFQAWNLAYNVSVEFDDYRQRYGMVQEGTEYLTRGVRQNREATRLVWYTGWFYGQKLGMADEKVQFRRLFADDEIAHERLLDEGIPVDSPEANGPSGKPDNWLVGRLWLNRGYDLVDSGVSIGRQTPINFFETGPKWRIKHAEAIEKEGILDDSAQNAWELAAEDWQVFGNRSIPTTSPFTIRLDQIEEMQRQVEEKREQFEELAGDKFEQARLAQVEKLTPEERAIYDKPANETTEEEANTQLLLNLRTKPSLTEVAKFSDPSVRLTAINLAGEIADLEERMEKTEAYRKQINYAYWKTLAAAEQEERTVKARRLIFEAEQANAQAELDQAIKLYEEAFVIWAEIFDDYPILTIDDTALDLQQSIRQYAVAVDSEEFDDEFPLKTFIDMMEEHGGINPEMYDYVRQEQRDKLQQRKAQLAAEEQARAEAEAAQAKADAEAAQAKADAEAAMPQADATDAKTPDAEAADADAADADAAEAVDADAAEAADADAAEAVDADAAEAADADAAEAADADAAEAQAEVNEVTPQGDAEAEPASP